MGKALNKTIDIIVDFDQVCALQSYPNNRCESFESQAARVLTRLTNNGHRLILFTMRSNGLTSRLKFGTWWGLSDAVNWFKKYNIPLYGIQKNPTQRKWTTSPKAYGQLIIDDTALGCPTLPNLLPYTSKSVADWNAIEKMLEELGLFDIVEKSLECNLN